MKRLIFSGLISMLFLAACESVPDYHPKAIPLTADFTINDSPDSIFVSRILDITNNSKGATSYTWDWGNGNHCTDQYPFIFYTDTGTYTIRLTTSNTSGETAVDSQSVTVLPL
jgi:PKD repeat protein